MNSPIIIAVIATIVTVVAFKQAGRMSNRLHRGLAQPVSLFGALAVASTRSRESASCTLQIKAILACADFPGLVDACGDTGGTTLEPACCVAGVGGATCNSPAIPTSAAVNQAMAANVTSASTH